jgi:streptomycin 6-kinase
MILPPEFVERVHRIFGDRGREWLPLLADIVARCRDKWGLSLGTITPHISMNYIEFTETDSGVPVVLKVGVPHPELFSEMEALRLYGGRGAARLLDYDPELGAILMQRLQPGTMLLEFGDNETQTVIAASVMRELFAPVPPTHGLPMFSHWVERAFRLTRTEWDPQELMPRDLIDLAEHAFEKINRGREDDAVLHGDLHHENIVLDDQSGWTAIDPKGAIGPRCLEVGRYLHNQIPSSLPFERREAMVRERIRIFASELDYSEEIVAASGLIDWVLSHCWSLENGHVSDDWHDGIKLGRFLATYAAVVEER